MVIQLLVIYLYEDTSVSPFDNKTMIDENTLTAK